jgi:hypothetical protein
MKVQWQVSGFLEIFRWFAFALFLAHRTTASLNLARRT